jgi:hypothetical protein
VARRDDPRFELHQARQCGVDQRAGRCGDGLRVIQVDVLETGLVQYQDSLDIEFLEFLLEVDVPVNRVTIEMQPGDWAIVLRLKERLPEGAVLTDAQMRTLPF